MKRIIACTLAFLAVIVAFGQIRTDSVKVYFNIGRWQYEPALGHNATSMDAFIEKIRVANDAHDLDRIIVRSYYSPEGSDRFNNRLAVKRCKAITQLLRDRAGISADMIESIPEGMSWTDLRNLVSTTPGVPAREKILDIIDNTPLWVYDSHGRIIDSRKKQLMDLQGGRPWRWMLKNIFPELRNAVAVSAYFKGTSGNGDSAASEKDNLLPEAGSNSVNGSDSGNASESGNGSGCRNGSDSVNASDSVYDSASGNELANGNGLTSGSTDADLDSGSGINTTVSNAASDNSLSSNELNGNIKGNDIDGSRNELDSDLAVEGLAIAPYHRLALKTNLLYYCALLPNIELEYLINKHWSVALEGNMAWWGSYKHEKSYRLVLFDGEARRWIKPRAPWHGMYVGVIAGGGYYDLENGSPGHYGWGIMSGLSFGYMWPIRRNLSLEAEVGAGYLHTRYKDYEPIEGHHVYLRSKELNYFGPIKLKFSIVWRFLDTNKSKHTNPAL